MRGGGGRRRLRPARRSGWVWVALTFGILVNGLRLRQRLEQFAVLGSDGAEADLTAEGGLPEMVFVTAAGVVLDEDTKRDAAELAAREGLVVVDLIPGDLHLEQALEAARQIDPASFREARLAPGRSALHAMAIEPSVAARMQLPRTEDLDVVEMARAAREAKHCAPTGMDVAIAPGLQAVPMRMDHRQAYLRALFGSMAPAATAAPAVQYGVMVAGVAVAPGWAIASLVASAMHPWLATAGTAVRPADLSPASAATRWVRLPVDALRSFRSRWEPAVEVAADPRLAARLRPAYAAELAAGTDRFFESPRPTCPMCDSTNLERRLEMPDLMQRKPGRFRLDRCTGCGHIFQNPRLSLAGLDFYYRDFYDGLAADDTEFVFAITDASYRGRVRMVARADPAPMRWLDVGGGYGHFCLIAAGELPDTRFDGLDMSDSIDDGVRRGWFREGHKGLFPELAAEVAGTYDVVSMNHYLEHTRAPLEELDAARTALRPGGHLLIELPDPECTLGQVLGPYWGPWFQPQHQHFLSRSAVRSALEERGFTVVDEETGAAHQPSDLMSLVIQLAERLAPLPAKPWLPEATLGARIGRGVTFAAMGPPLVAAVIADFALAPALRALPHGSNAFRILARRDG